MGGGRLDGRWLWWRGYFLSEFNLSLDSVELRMMMAACLLVLDGLWEKNYTLDFLGVRRRRPNPNPQLLYVKLFAAAASMILQEEVGGTQESGIKNTHTHTHTGGVELINLRRWRSITVLFRYFDLGPGLSILIWTSSTPTLKFLGLDGWIHHLS